MLNKSLNIQKEIKNTNGSIIGFLNAQISIGYGNINFSIQIMDKSYVVNNPDILKMEYDSFMEDIKTEAITNGWEALADKQIE